MRVSIIEDHEILPGHKRITMRAPEGHDPIEGEIRDADMVATRDSIGTVYRAKVVLEEGDLERLKAGEPFWVSFWGGVVPFDVGMMTPQ